MIRKQIYLDRDTDRVRCLDPFAVSFSLNHLGV